MKSKNIWKSNTYFWGTVMFVQDGFLYLIVTRHKLTVWVAPANMSLVQSPTWYHGLLNWNYVWVQNESGGRTDIAWGLYTTRVYMAPAHAVRSRTKVLLANSVWQDGRYNIIIKSIGKKKYIGFFSFNVSYSTLLNLPPLRLHCVGGCWDRTQDCCNFGIDSQTL